MKEKTSVSLSKELLIEIRRVAGPKVNRSDFLESAGWDRVAALKRRRREAGDLAALNRHSKALNREASDVLEYQGDW